PIILVAFDLPAGAGHEGRYLEGTGSDRVADRDVRRSRLYNSGLLVADDQGEEGALSLEIEDDGQRILDLDPFGGEAGGQEAEMGGAQILVEYSPHGVRDILGRQNRAVVKANVGP